MNPLLAALDPIAVRQGTRLLGDLPDSQPTGAPHGLVGEAKGARHLVVLGDEFAGGWGLAPDEETLAQGLARRMVETGLPVRATSGSGDPATVEPVPGVVWQVLASPKATIREIHQQWVPQLPAQLDQVVLWVGWGDLLERTPVTEWRDELAATLAILRRAGARVTVVGCPPVSAMPRLRWPLSAVLQDRADAFDRESRTLAAGSGGFVPSPRPTTGPGSSDAGGWFQSDGVHFAGTGQHHVTQALMDRV